MYEASPRFIMFMRGLTYTCTITNRWSSSAGTTFRLFIKFTWPLNAWEIDSRNADTGSSENIIIDY
jgi:hypothetical protein